MVIASREWMKVFNRVHVVIGYNPSDFGQPWAKGCRTNCMSCWYGTDYLSQQPSYLNSIKRSTIGNLGETLGEVTQTAAEKAKPIFGEVLPNERTIRISGSVLGDPVMADPDACKAISAAIRGQFPEGVCIQADTVANQRIFSAQEWRAIGIDTVALSLNAAGSEAGYMAFHGVARERFVMMQHNVRNILDAGLELIFSYVWAEHPRNCDEVKAKIPDFWRNEQNEDVRLDFASRLGIEHPTERFWRVHLPTDTYAREELFRQWGAREKWYKSLKVG
jgi:hypothetical protein